MLARQRILISPLNTNPLSEILKADLGSKLGGFMVIAI